MNLKAKLLLILVLCFCICTPISGQEVLNYCGTQMLYFQHNATTTPAGYEELINYPSGGGQVDESVTITSASGPTLIDAYILPEGSLADVISLRKGLRTFTTYHYVSTAVGTTRINFTAFRRFQNGSEFEFYSASSEDIDALTVSEYVTTYVNQNDLPITEPTERLGIKMYASTTHPSPVTVHFVYQGTTNVSRFMSGFFVCEETKKVVYVEGGEPALPIEPLLPILGIVVALVSFRRMNNG